MAPPQAARLSVITPARARASNFFFITIISFIPGRSVFCCPVNVLLQYIALKG